MTDSEHREMQMDDNDNLLPRQKRSWKKILGVMLLLFAVGAGVFVYMLRSEPQAVRQQREFISKVSKTELQQIAEDVDRKMYDAQFVQEYLPDAQLSSFSTKQILDAIPDDVEPVTKIHLTVNEINAWMLVEFENWMSYRDYQLPEEVSDPVFALDGKSMLMSLELSAGGITQSFSAKFQVEILEDGMARLTVEEFYAGMIPIPAGGISQFMADRFPENNQFSDAAEWLDKLETVEFKPVMKLESKRKAKVLSYEITDEGIELTVKLVNYARHRSTKPRLAAAPAQ